MGDSGGIFVLFVVVFYAAIVGVGLWLQYLIIRTAVLHALQRRDAQRPQTFSSPPTPAAPVGPIARAGWYMDGANGNRYWNGSSWTTPPQ